MWSLDKATRYPNTPKQNSPVLCAASSTEHAHNTKMQRNTGINHAKWCPLCSLVDGLREPLLLPVVHHLLLLSVLPLAGRCRCLALGLRCRGLEWGLGSGEGTRK